MKLANWKDYELIDTSMGERLERWGNIILIRPDPQIIWNTPKTNPLWKEANAKYIRSKSGGGAWKLLKKTPDVWRIKYEDLSFQIKMMGFNHTGIFPEQAVNWERTMGIIRNSTKKLNVLNLFAYTGGATLACAKAGANVCHVDASKGMVSWARENAMISGFSESPIRWIVDDCIKFVQRELRRGNKYDGIIMDPPSYGRGPSGEIWKLEDQLFDFIKIAASLLSEDAKFFILNSYTTGLSPSVMGYLLNTIITKNKGGKVSSDEIGLSVTESKFAFPSGATSIWTNE